MNLKETEEKIKNYYESLKVIEGLKHKLEICENRKKDLENKINNSVIYLNDDFRAVRYNKIGTKNSGIKTSPQERAVDKAFSVLEKNLENVKTEILLIQEQISSIEAENSVIAFILKDLNPEYEKILDGFYNKFSGYESYIKLSLDLNMDKATIYRKREKLVKSIKKWIEFYNKF